MDEVANKVGVQKIGWILTDLVAEDLKLGTVRHLRHKDTYFVSAEECIMTADFQNKHPNVCKLSPTNKFGSKFVTVIVTGLFTHRIFYLFECYILNKPVRNLSIQMCPYFCIGYVVLGLHSCHCGFDGSRLLNRPSI